MRDVTDPVQREVDEEILQGKFEQSPDVDAADTVPVQREEKPNNTGLPNPLKSGIKSLPCMNMDHVKVHAQSSEIHAALGSQEASHVMQHRQGKVKATVQRALIGINDDALEMEADVMGVQAMSAGAAGVAQTDPLGNGASTPPVGFAPVQRKYELCNASHVTKTQDHRAKTVRAENIRGSTLGPAANSPSVSPFGWEDLKGAGHTLANTSGNNSHYNAVRAHLMNGRLGGPGDETWNLVPAPAQINSQMSAGPETDAKLLVDEGHTIWLETKVAYHGNSSTATDFTSVVPNAIDMKWGTQDGKIAGHWSAAIELPVAPLQGAEALEYKNWDPAKSHQLVEKLATQSNQVRAQAFDLVANADLKLEILRNYAQVYLSMARIAKGQILGALDATGRASLLQAVGVYGSSEARVEEGVIPLAEAGKPLEAQQLFATLDSKGQRATLIAWKDELLKHLGAIGDEWSIRDYTIFKYNDDNSKARLVNSMDESRLKTFLSSRSSTERPNILDTWANWVCSPNDWNTKNDFVQKTMKIPRAYREEYAKKAKRGLDSERYFDGRGSPRIRTPAKKGYPY